MKIFILEDRPERMTFFQKKFKGHKLFASDNVSEAKKLFKKHEPFGLIFLDHDLDLQTHVDSREENTGYQFAKFLEEKDINIPVIIHSMNIPGARNMMSVLERQKVKFIPYPVLMTYLKGGLEYCFNILGI